MIQLQHHLLEKQLLIFIIKKPERNEHFGRRTSFRKPRKTTKRIDRVIEGKAVVDPMKNSVIIAHELREEYFPIVSRSIVLRKLNENELFCRSKETVDKWK